MPSPKTPSRRALAGEKRPSRLAPYAGTARAPEPPEPPSDLSGDARVVWHELAEKIWRAGYLAETDTTAFEVMCGILATERQARRVLELEGLTTRSEAGTLKAHPALRAAETARQQARAYLESFGMTPAGRRRVEPASDPREANEFSAFADIAGPGMRTS